MKRILYTLTLAAMATFAFAQTDTTKVEKDTTEGFRFTTVDRKYCARKAKSWT